MRAALVWTAILVSATLGVHCERKNAAIVTFQRNEEELLADWISYHADIVGYSRLYIIDHSSDVPEVQDTLALAAFQGVNIIPFSGPFMRKAKTLTTLIKEVFRNESDVGFAIPLDVDEFIVAQDDSHAYSADPTVIQDALSALPQDGFKYKFGQILGVGCDESPFSIAPPLHRRVLDAVYFSKPSFHVNHKTFYSHQGFMSTDQGNHAGRVAADGQCSAARKRKQAGLEHSGGACYHRTRLAIVHFGNSAATFDAWRAKMERGASAYGYSSKTRCHVGQRGRHYCEAMHHLAGDVEAMQRKFVAHRCSGTLYYSPFIALSILGHRSDVLDYTSAPIRRHEA